MQNIIIPSIVEQATRNSTEQVNEQITDQVNAAMSGYVYKTNDELYNIPIIEAIEGELPPEEEVNALIQLISENNELKQELQELIADHIRRLNNKEYNEYNRKLCKIYIELIFY